jgi:hypothetical protein
MRAFAAAALVLGALSLSVSQQSWAQPSAEETSRATARALGYEGIEAYNAGDFPLASERLEAAYALLRVPSLALWSARALIKLGRFVEAAERYQVVATLPVPQVGREVHEAAVREANEERALLLPRIPVLTIVVDGAPAGAVAGLDGRTLPSASTGADVLADPGPHRLTLTAGGRSIQREVVLREGEKLRVVLELPPQSPQPSASAAHASRPSPAGLSSPAPAFSDAYGRAATATPPPSSGFQTAGWVAMGLGGAGIVLGAVAGSVAVGQNAELDEVCEDDVCPRSAQPDVDAYDRTRALSTVGFVVGAVALTTGVVLLLVPSSGGRPAVEARLGPGSAAVSGVF